MWPLSTSQSALSPRSPYLAWAVDPGSKYDTAAAAETLDVSRDSRVRATLRAGGAERATEDGPTAREATVASRRAIGFACDGDDEKNACCGRRNRRRQAALRFVEFKGARRI